MAKLIDVANAMFKNKKEWYKISDEDKITNFFIFNRFFSKKYPEKSQLLNLKNIDKVSSMNLWYHFMINEPYPHFFWSKGSSKETPILPIKDLNLLMRKLKVKRIDLDYLLENHFDFIKEELKYYNSLEKQ